MGLMNNIFRPNLDKSVVIFLDNILMYSKTLNDYRVHLGKILQVLKDNQLYAKVSKYEFGKSKLNILDHRVTVIVFQVMSEKIDVIQKWTTHEYHT